MTEPRFVVTELTGWPIRVGTHLTSGATPTTSYFVQDTLHQWRVVADFSPGRRGGLQKRYRAAYAQALCDRLNAEHEAVMARG